MGYSSGGDETYCGATTGKTTGYGDDSLSDVGGAGFSCGYYEVSVDASSLGG